MAAAVVLALAAPASADQSGAAVLTGTIVDGVDKKPLVDVVVIATSSAVQGQQIVVTDASGYYRIPDLPSGVYSVTFEKEQFRPYTRDAVNLPASATIRVNAVLFSLTATGESVVVTAEAPTIDVGSSSTGSNITSEFTRRVPLAPPSGKGSAARSFEAVAEVTPGAKADTYGLSVSGASSLENSYQVDGHSVSNPGFGMIGTGLSSEFLKEVNVISGGYLPEYGRTMGGVLNAVTKSGSNEFHGGVFGFFTPGAFQGTGTQVKSAVGTVSSSTPLSFIGDAGLDLGGPIIKDKLWFYGGFDYATTNFKANRSFYRQIADPMAPGGFQVGPDGNPVKELIPGADESYDAVSRTMQGILKLTYALDSDNRFSLSAYGAPSTSGGAGKFAIDHLQEVPETLVNTTTPFNGTYSSIAHQINNRPYDVAAKWTTQFLNKRALVDTSLGWHHQEVDVIPSDGSLPGSGQGLAGTPSVSWQRSGPYHPITDFEDNKALRDACGPDGSLCPVVTYTSGGPATNTGALELQTFNRYNAGSTITYLFQAMGHHVLKAGLNLEVSQFSHVAAHSGGASLLERSDGSRFDELEGYGVLVSPDNPVSLEPRHIRSRSLTEGGFVQDSWAVMDRFTVNLGARYDAQQLYGNSGKLGLTLPNQWSPRVGIIYDPTHEGRAKLYGNYARYYESVPVHLADASLSGTPNIVSTHPGIDSGTCDVRMPPYCLTNSGRLIGDANRGNAPSTSFSSSQRWGAIGGTAKSIDPALQPSSSDEIVLGGEYEVLENTRAGASYTRRWLNYFIEDLSNDGLQTYFLANPGYGMASDFPQAERNYDALTLYLMKSFSRGWLASGSYTLSYLRGNLGGLFRAQNGELDPNHNADFDSKIYTINASGPLNGDHTHDLKLFGAKDWALGRDHRLSSGAAVRVRSGEPINYWASDSGYGPQINLLLPRGSAGRLPWTGSLDVNLGYRYSLPRQRDLVFTIDVFNLLNFQARTGVDESYTLTAAQNDPGKPLASAYTQSTPHRPLEKADLNPNFLNPTKYQPPRAFRFGLRATF
ncbi:MAG TPA: TonB-dependent receptor [Polyangia bacterium]|nr:TonB-dependent receptor [Polyangia bacterium]